MKQEEQQQQQQKQQQQQEQQEEHQQQQQQQQSAGHQQNQSNNFTDQGPANEHRYSQVHQPPHDTNGQPTCTREQCRKRALTSTLWLAYLAINIAYSIMLPFFPKEV